MKSDASIQRSETSANLKAIESIFYITYSFRNDLAGLAIAALIAWKLMVSKAIDTASTVARPNVDQESGVR